MITKHNRSRGFTLIVGFVGCNSLTGGSNTEVDAKEWAESLGIQVKLVSCIGADNNSDGYESCTVVPADGSEPLAVECVGTFGFGHGCRFATVRNH